MVARKPEINDGTGLAGSGHDLLTVSGTLTVGASPGSRFTVSPSSLLVVNTPDNTLGNTPGNIVNFDARANHSCTLVSTSGAVLGFSADKVSGDTGGFTHALTGDHRSVAAVGNGMNLQFTAAVPGPGRWALMLAGQMGQGLGAGAGSAAAPQLIEGLTARLTAPATLAACRALGRARLEASGQRCR